MIGFAYVADAASDAEFASVSVSAAASVELAGAASPEAHALARSDPHGLAQLALERAEKQVRDYRCVFIKRERVNGKLTDEQHIEVLFRREPLSVFMKWIHNADRARRALWIDRPDFVDSKGRKVARIEPAGVIARALVAEVTRPIDGDDARKASRRTINEFGFLSTLRLLEQYNSLAERDGVLDFRYEGEGEVDGRPTFVLVRRLPPQPAGRYPDAKMVLHLDQEWLLPTALFSYADPEGTILLGSYVYHDVMLNPGLTEEHFRF